jgi:hypothetical protein
VRAIRSLLSLFAVITLAAGCATGPGRASPLGGGHGYFISPNGQPFRFDGGSPHGRWLAGADTNSDGRLSQTEFAADARRFFAAVDADSNELATSAEVSAWRAREARELEAMLAFIPARTGDEPRRRSRPVWTQGGGFVRTQGPGAPRRPSLVTLLNEREPVLASDADFNRRVTPAEFEAATLDRFRLLDLDGDSVLSEGELAQFLDR